MESSSLTKAICSICNQEIFDNINTEKILTCGRCVITLMSVSKEKKIERRKHLLSKGLTEQARSVESFIVLEDDTDIATFETSLRKRGSNRLVHRVKRGLNG